MINIESRSSKVKKKIRAGDSKAEFIRKVELERCFERWIRLDREGTKNLGKLF